MDHEQVTALCRGETAAKRRRIIREWASALGLTEQEALELGRASGIINR